eukprot:gene23047-24387_t
MPALHKSMLLQVRSATTVYWSVSCPSYPVGSHFQPFAAIDRRTPLHKAAFDPALGKDGGTSGGVSVTRIPTVHRIALLFNANKIFDRDIIAGIGEYLTSTRASWDLFLEEDFRCRLQGIERWQGHGIIADFDDPATCEALSGVSLPVVAVGGSYAQASDYPPGVPYVATDNFKLVKLAYDHLIEAGLQNFACFSLPQAGVNRWAQEREK